MKVVINVCFGGFGLSASAVRRLAELNGRKCYFFKNQRDPYDLHVHVPISIQEADRVDSLFFTAFDIPNPNEVLAFSDKTWREDGYNERYSQHCLYFHDISRADQKLIQVVEELGEKANGRYAKLRIVEIPDDTNYEIDEYDGNEHIAEIHRTWR